MASRFKEKIIYKNKNGKIICIQDMFGNVRYVLLNVDGNYVKDILIPFKVEDYL